MKILKVNHLGIVHKDLNQAEHFFGSVLGLHKAGAERVSDQLVDVTFFETQSGTRLEFLTPTEPNSPIGKFQEKFGAGIHHIALEVDDLDEWLEHLAKHNVKMIDSKGRTGAHHTKIAFVHPHATGGILVELTQESSHT